MLRAEQSLASAFNVVDAFLRWEFRAVNVSPDVRAAADLIREHFPPAHRVASQALFAWKKTRDQGDFEKLRVALETVGSLADLAMQYLPRQ